RRRRHPPHGPGHRPAPPRPRCRHPAGHRSEKGRLMTTTRRAARTTGALALTAALLAGCGTGGGGDPGPGGAAEVTVTNCDAEETFPSPAERIYVAGDGNMLAMLLALGAQERIAGASGMDDPPEVLST